MPLQPVLRRSVPDAVFDQVLDEVVSGALGPGASLPSERRLAEVLGVSRPAVREALQRMTQTRLLEVRHGGATTVRDYRRHAGLDLLPALLVRGGSLDVAAVRSVLEARLVMGPGVAALAAARRTDVQVERLTETVAAYAASDDPVDRQRYALAYWDLVVDAADSITFRLLFNSLRVAYEPALAVLAPVLGAGEAAGPYRVLTASLEEGDPDTARAAAERVLRPSTDALLTALDAVEGRCTDDLDRLAHDRLAADEARVTSSCRGLTLGQAWRAFLRHPSPWMISVFLVTSIVGRIMVGSGSSWELLIPVALVALFPAIEWVIHVGILHWRPRRVGRVQVDSLLARKHREHHADPRDLPLVFIPWPVLTWLLPAYVVVALLAVPSATAAWTLLVSVYALMFGYEWTHYLIHSDHRPGTRVYRAVWRNHRLHHYKNEHYWFTVTTAGTADRLFGTYPDPATVSTSATARNLHGAG